MLSNLGHVIIGVTDNIMVGHVSAVSLAAAGLALVVFNVLLLFGIGVSYAITPLVAAADGEANDEEVIQTVRHGLVINLITSLLLVVAVAFGSNLLYELNQPAEVISEAIPFLQIIAISMIPILVFQTFKQFAEGLSKTRVALFVMIGAILLNIPLNYIFIYGHLGLPSMGLEGAGYATFISRIFMALSITLYIYHHHSFKKYRGIFRFGKYKTSLINKMLHLGVPSGVQFIFEVAAFDFSLVMMGWIGTQTQAAHQIAINMATISYMTTAGLAAAATIRVGYFLGANDFTSLRKAAWSTLAIAMAVMFAWGILFIGGRHFLPALYVEEKEVIMIASSLLIIAGLFQLADGAQVVCTSALRGLQDVKIPSVLILVSYWMIGLPLGYVLTFKMNVGATGIWWGLLTGLTLTAIAMFIRLKYQIGKLERAAQKITPTEAKDAVIN
ncbi:MAG TPA: MATE family efflux transporter [Chryseosolibacter sp.]|nr:MATE family efflux transporter [Chryseosolibacter sp.]